MHGVGRWIDRLIEYLYDSPSRRLGQVGRTAVRTGEEMHRLGTALLCPFVRNDNDYPPSQTPFIDTVRRADSMLD